MGSLVSVRMRAERGAAAFASACRSAGWTRRLTGAAAVAAGLAACRPGTAARGEERLEQALVSELVPPGVADSGGMSLTEALRARRSVREFGPERLSAAEISELAWAAQGITHGEGFRTAPSAGALYPLELYVVTPEGLYHYRPRGNRLVELGGGDLRPALQRAAHGQEAVGQGAAVFVIAAVYARTAAKYGPERGARYVHIEVGHAAQNLLLQAAALGLGAVPVGAFDDGAVHRVLGLPPDQAPLYLIPVGRSRR